MTNNLKGSGGKEKSLKQQEFDFEKKFIESEIALHNAYAQQRVDIVKASLYIFLGLISIGVICWIISQGSLISFITLCAIIAISLVCK